MGRLGFLLLMLVLNVSCGTLPDPTPVNPDHSVLMYRESHFLGLKAICSNSEDTSHIAFDWTGRWAVITTRYRRYSFARHGG